MYLNKIAYHVCTKSHFVFEYSCIEKYSTDTSSCFKKIASELLWPKESWILNKLRPHSVLLQDPRSKTYQGSHFAYVLAYKVLH